MEMALMKDNNNPNILKNISNKNELFESILCKLCKSWPIKPLTCNKCESLYCQSCINLNNIICKICTSSLTTPSKLIMNIIKSATFNCLHCGKQQNYEDLISHTTYCEKNPHRKILCNNCKIEIAFDKLKSHNCIDELISEIKEKKEKLEVYNKSSNISFEYFKALKQSLK